MPLIGTDGYEITQKDLKFRLDPQKNGFEVPFPPNYPITPFYEYQINNESPFLARIAFSFRDKINVYNKKVNVKDTMTINSFYVYTHPSLTSLASLEEKELTKGLGRKLLCIAVKYAIVKGKVSNKGSIHLEASGGSCSEEDIIRFMEEWDEDRMNKSFEELKFTDFPIEKLDEISINEKASALCHYFQNKYLVSYYMQYGLKPIDQSDAYYTVMMGSISSVLQNCKSRLGSKVKNRKRSKKNRKLSKRLY